MSVETPTTDPWWWANPTLKQAILTDPVGVLKDRGLTPPDDIPPGVAHQFIRMVYLLWVNGELTPIDRFYIDPSDEGLLFGRGVWESTRTVDGVPWLWNLHVDRILHSAKLLNIDLSPDRVPTAEQVKQYVTSLGSQDVVLRLNVTAGRAGKTGVVWMSAAPQAVPPGTLRLKSARNPVDKGQAYLMLKTFQYATRLRFTQQATTAGFDSALMIDPQGMILEAAQANIFVRLPQGWATPKSEGGFLPGTVRRYLIEKSPLPITEMPIPYTKLPEVREVFVTNSNVGIIPVTQIDGYTYSVGEETRDLMRWLEPKKAGGGIEYRFRDRGGVAR